MKPLLASILISILSGGFAFPQQPADTVSTVPPGASYAQSSWLTVTSSPDSVQVKLDNESEGKITPFDIEITPGVHIFHASCDGYEPLNYEYDFPAGKNYRVNMILAEEQPIEMAAEELGLEYKELKAPRDEEEAEKIRSRFNNMAQSFIIIPTGQGVLARLIMGDSNSRDGDILIAIGAGLTVSAYFLGKVFSSRELKKIKAGNSEISEENVRAKRHNLMVTQALQERHDEDMERWQEENKDRGIVEITIQ